MKINAFLAGVFSFALCCPGLAQTRAELLREKFDSTDTNYVFVVLHRADWRNHPENSLSSIQSAIQMGGDMVEIDVAKTKDGVHVLSHDGKLDRVSDKQGRICDLTLAEVREARLKEGQGGKDAKLTDERVPTLEEALEVCRGKILVNIDKFNGDPEGITAVIQKMGVARQVVLKGYGDYEYIKGRTGEPWKYVEDHSFIYMPVVGAGTNEAGRAGAQRVFQAWDAQSYAPPAYEVCIPGEPPLEMFADMAKSPNHPRIWINTLWDSLAHNHSESLRGTDFTAERVWGWCLGLGATMIQTDRPADCIAYLEELGRHTLASEGDSHLVHWDFPRDGNCHEGLPFSDGKTGVLVWGGGCTINLTLGRSDLWDHRGGAPSGTQPAGCGENARRGA